MACSILTFFVVFLASTFNLAIADITIYRPDAEDQDVSQILSFSIIGMSPIDVIEGVTEYAVSEVDSLFVLMNSVATRTVFSTPTTISYVIERGSGFLGNTIFQTIVNPTDTLLELGFVACTATVPQTPGGEVQCIEVVTDSGTNFSSSGTTIGFNARLTPVFTIKEADVTTPIPTPSSIAGNNPISSNIPSSPTPSPIVTVLPSPTSSATRKYTPSIQVLMVILACAGVASQVLL